MGHNYILSKAQTMNLTGEAQNINLLVYIQYMLSNQLNVYRYLSCCVYELIILQTKGTQEILSFDLVSYA